MKDLVTPINVWFCVQNMSCIHLCLSGHRFLETILATFPHSKTMRMQVFKHAFSNAKVALDTLTTSPRLVENLRTRFLMQHTLFCSGCKKALFTGRSLSATIFSSSNKQAIWFILLVQERCVIEGSQLSWNFRCDWTCILNDYFLKRVLPPSPDWYYGPPEKQDCVDSFLLLWHTKVAPVSHRKQAYLAPSFVPRRSPLHYRTIHYPFQVPSQQR